MSGTIAFPPNPTVGQLYTFNNTTWVWTGTVWANATTGANFVTPAAMQAAILNAGYIPQNYVDNSGFLLNQRGYATGTALAAGDYGFDRWKAGASGATLTFATMPASILVTITAGSIQQVIEGQNFVTGGYTLSWSGTATGRIYPTAGSPPAYAASPLQFSATAGALATIEFTGGTLGQVQLQMGSTATPWQPLPPQVEVARCQRMLWQAPSMTLLSTGNASFGGAIIFVTFPVTMRAGPSVITGGAPGVVDFQTSNSGCNIWFTNQAAAGATAGVTPLFSAEL